MYELKELKTKIVDSYYAKQFIEKWHYSHLCHACVLAVGQYYGMDLVNLIVFNYCAGRMMAQSVIKDGSNNNVIELARMVSLEPKPKNLETYSISRALKVLHKELPNIEVVVSYADNSWGHKGYCYQASNFVYYGQSSNHKWIFLDGKRIHEKTLYDRYGFVSEDKLKEILGDRIVFQKETETKSRYYRIIADNKKKVQENIIVKSLPYPKGDNTRYDMSIKGNFVEKDEHKASQSNDKVILRQLNMFDFLD